MRRHFSFRVLVNWSSVDNDNDDDDNDGGDPFFVFLCALPESCFEGAGGGRSERVACGYCL